MFSKKYLSIVLALGLITVSCTPKIGEAPPDVGQQKLDTQCLASLKPVITGFVKGEASDSDIAQGWDCAASGIKKFKKYVYGRTSDRYGSDELVKFLENNFLDPSSPKISDDLRLQFMKFKQLFVGGSVDYVTRDELDKIIDMFGDLKSVTLHLNPYMKILAQNWSITGSRDVQADMKSFESASAEVQSAAADLAALVVRNNQSYELDDFVSFLKDFAQFYGEAWPLADTIQKYMPVVKKVKKAIAGGDQNAVGSGEWNSFMLMGVRGYIQYLRYYYFIKSASDTGSGIRLAYLSRSVEDLLGAFQDLVQVKPADPSCGVQVLKNGTRQTLSCISKQEITDMLSTFSQVWSDFKVSDKLVDEAMKIKKVYFGGSTETMTSLDFERGKNKVGTLKDIVEKFLPYYSIYSFEWDRSGFDENSAQQFFQDSQNSLQTSVESLGTLFEDSYNVDSFVI